MSKTHRLKEYLTYRRKAKGRHGVHSPFVYALAEKMLRQKSDSIHFMLATAKHKKLVNKIISYFKCAQILWLTDKSGETESFITIQRKNDNQVKLRSEPFVFENFSDYPPPDLYLIDRADPAGWRVFWEKYKPFITPESIVLINSVHHSKAHTSAWKEIIVDKKIKLSVDLFKAGLLFFKDDFKEKQHFVLK